MKLSENINELSQALSQAQGELKNPYNSADNPFYKSKYAPLPEILNEIRPILNKHGISIIQSPVGTAENIGVQTMVMHTSGQYIICEPYYLHISKVDAQTAGGAITYARRYALNGLLGISGDDDDDGNTAIAKPNTQKTESESTPVCEECQKPIKAQKTKSGTMYPFEVAARTLAKYGKNLCVDCAKKIKDEDNGS